MSSEHVIRAKATVDANDDRWKDAIECTLSTPGPGVDDNVARLQIAGAGSRSHTGDYENAEHKPHTCFARIVDTSSSDEMPQSRISHQITIQQIVSQVLQRINVSIEAQELINIGAVWIVPAEKDSNKRPRKSQKTNNSKPRRATLSESALSISLDDWKHIILRIHHGALRFRKAQLYDWGKPHIAELDRGNCSESHQKEGVIINEDLSVGYAIINKPPGVPVHGYVYNSVENVAYMYETALRKRYSEVEPSAFRVSVPQRLDNDTSGVLVVAVNSSFASYMSKLLEKKTTFHTKPGGDTPEQDKDTAPRVRKRYNCLVCLRSRDDIQRLVRLAATCETVTHYLSSARSTPRLFLEKPDETAKGTSWLECHLRIIAVGFDASTLSVPVSGSQDSIELLRKLWNCNVIQNNHFEAVTQVEIELLTGRTHQIRGQMSALGFPLVGDTMYMGGLDGAAYSRVALHCCEISFPKPMPTESAKECYGDDGKSRQTLLRSSAEELCIYRSDRAWWSVYIS